MAWSAIDQENLREEASVEKDRMWQIGSTCRSGRKAGWDLKPGARAAYGLFLRMQPVLVSTWRTPWNKMALPLFVSRKEPLLAAKLHACSGFDLSMLRIILRSWKRCG